MEVAKKSDISLLQSYLLCDSMAVVPIHFENKSQMLVGVNPLTSDFLV